MGEFWAFSTMLRLAYMGAPATLTMAPVPATIGAKPPALAEPAAEAAVAAELTAGAGILPCGALAQAARAAVQAPAVSQLRIRFIQRLQ